MWSYTIFHLWDKRFTFLYWIAVWVFLSLLLASLFDGIAGESELESVLENLPEALRGAFNISSGYFSQVENFVSGQFLTLYTLAGGVMGIFMGVGAIRGKIDSGYIGTVLMQPHKRWQVALSEWVIQLIFCLLSAGIVALSSWYLFSQFTSQEEVSLQFFIMAMLGSVSIQVFSSGLGMFLGMYIPSSSAQAIGSGFIMITWFLNGLADVSGFPDVLKPFSPFYFFDVSNLYSEYSLIWSDWTLLIGLGWALFLCSVWIFQDSDII
jgi:ABC-type transport system involved in multi-copper enzyme maturation permease subunit